MTLEEAIVNLMRYKHDHHSYSTDEIGKSMQLGIEALERLEDARIQQVLANINPLPSETLE